MLPVWAIIVIVIAAILLIGSLIMLGIYMKTKRNNQMQNQRLPEQASQQLMQANPSHQIHTQIHQFYYNKFKNIMGRCYTKQDQENQYSPVNTGQLQKIVLQNGVPIQSQQSNNIPTNISNSILQNSQVQTLQQQRNILKNSPFSAPQSYQAKVANSPNGYPQSKLAICQNYNASEGTQTMKQSHNSETKVLDEELDEQGTIFSRNDSKIINLSNEKQKYIIPVSTSAQWIPNSDTSKDKSNDVSMTTYGQVLTFSHLSELTEDNSCSNLKEEGILLKQPPRIPMRKIDIPAGLGVESMLRKNNLSSSSINQSMSQNELYSLHTSNFRTYKEPHSIFNTDEKGPSNLVRMISMQGYKKQKEISYKPFVQEPFHNSKSQLLRSTVAQDQETERGFDYGKNILRSQNSISHISLLYDH